MDRTTPPREVEERLIAAMDAALDDYTTARRALHHRTTTLPCALYAAYLTALAVIAYLFIRPLIPLWGTPPAGPTLAVLVATPFAMAAGTLALLPGMILTTKGPETWEPLFRQRILATVSATEALSEALSDYTDHYPLSGLNDDTLRRWIDHCPGAAHPTPPSDMPRPEVTRHRAAQEHLRHAETALRDELHRRAAPGA